MTSPIKIDIWSDIACPWCYIGKRHLEAGLAALGDDAPEVEIEYHSFELSPDTPLDFEGSTVEYLSRVKGMPVEQVEQMLQHVTGVAAKAGLDYHFELVAHTKTLKAHELLHFAKAHGKQLDMKERLLKAYFVEGGRVNRIDQLVAFAEELGLDGAAAREALESSRYADDVQADIAQARNYGIQGVPFFVLDGKYGISGAQPADVFSQAIAQVAGEREGSAA
ncbi:DsbA family oxidoreductase [Agromyces aerolatus]|uniref:DsbA family oxidoreductase n=1 Tax=Agromyces sp. LY-1074 TaxID=3074080 RepID=UPI0028551EC6|nr:MULTISPECIES: DsbA family oxidoreductase [unclassified Agromyces]MDR5700231.1 DsbA family oxidoreductase [Agromyces sp. LY-1074]MDR5706401.1 DsbA family oxidoreductase [Agromyces sp. LY-1358]